MKEILRLSGVLDFFLCDGEKSLEVNFQTLY